MSPPHVKGMRAFAERDGHEIAHLRDRFDGATADVVWMSALGQEGGWIVISADLRIPRNPAEKATWHESGLTAFFFASPWGHDSYWKQTVSLVTWWPIIMDQARRTPTGHGFSLPKKGSTPIQIYPERARLRGR